MKVDMEQWGGRFDAAAEFLLSLSENGLMLLLFVVACISLFLTLMFVVANTMDRLQRSRHKFLGRKMNFVEDELYNIFNTSVSRLTKEVYKRFKTSKCPENVDSCVYLNNDPGMQLSLAKEILSITAVSARKASFTEI